MKPQFFLICLISFLISCGSDLPLSKKLNKRNDQHIDCITIRENCSVHSVNCISGSVIHVFWKKDTKTMYSKMDACGGCSNKFWQGYDPINFLEQNWKSLKTENILPFQIDSVSHKIQSHSCYVDMNFRIRGESISRKINFFMLQKYSSLLKFEERNLSWERNNSLSFVKLYNNIREDLGHKKRKKLYILGTVHFPTSNVNDDSILQVLERIKPDIILMESDTSNFNDDFSFKKIWDENEYNAVIKYK